MTDGRLLDEVMATAWPAAVTEQYQGWTFRHTAGVTRRANSVRVVGHPGDLDDAIDRAEHFHADHGTAPTFFVSEASTPPEVDDAIRDRGYRPAATTWMLRAETATIAGDDLPAHAADEADEAWLAIHRKAEPTRTDDEFEIVRTVLLRPAAPSRFVTVAVHCEPIAVGQVVVDRGIGCIQCLATRPGARRRGAGRAVVRRLAAEARGLGADDLLAAVMADNDASLGLFESLGFTRSHRYRYLVAPR